MSAPGNNALKSLMRPFQKRHSVVFFYSNRPGGQTALGPMRLSACHERNSEKQCQASRYPPEKFETFGRSPAHSLRIRVFLAAGLVTKPGELPFSVAAMVLLDRGRGGLKIATTVQEIQYLVIAYNVSPPQ